jgi:hypothetical protein
VIMMATNQLGHLEAALDRGKPASKLPASNPPNPDAGPTSICVLKLCTEGVC